MKIRLSTSVLQRGRSGVSQYVLSLVRALLPAARTQAFTLFALEGDRPLLPFAEGAMRARAFDLRSTAATNLGVDARAVARHGKSAPRSAGMGVKSRRREGNRLLGGADSTGYSGRHLLKPSHPSTLAMIKFGTQVFCETPAFLALHPRHPAVARSGQFSIR